MKSKFDFLLILAILTMFSCSRDIDDVKMERKLQTRSVSQSVSSVFDWENISSVVFPEYGTTILPWYNGTESNIPEYIIKDYKKIDGWEMVYNFCNDPVLAKKGKYYLIFYNKLTGILRVFYYNIYDVTSANTALWKVSLNNQTSILNGVSHFTWPMNEREVVFAYISNVLDLPTKAIAKGWNCFDVELCYDSQYSTKELKLSIGVYEIKTEHIVLTGDVSLQSDGTIIAVTSNNPVSNVLQGGVTEFGKTAATKVVKNIGTKILPGILQGAATSILSGGIGGLVNSGVNLIFGSFLGKFSTTTPLEQSLSFKTNGKININGTITSQQQSNILPVANLVVPGSQIGISDNIIPSFNNVLGVWNLSNKPVLQMSDEAVWIRKPTLRPEYAAQYDYRRKVQLDASSVNVIVNPEVMNCISEYTVESEVVYYDVYEGNSQWGEEYYSGYASWFKMTGETKLYSDSLNVIFRRPDIDQNVIRPNYPQSGLIERIDRFGVERWLERGCSVFNPNYVVKVSVTLYPKSPYDTTPIIMTRSYIPEYKIVKGLLDYNNGFN